MDNEELFKSDVADIIWDLEQKVAEYTPEQLHYLRVCISNRLIALIIERYSPDDNKNTDLK